MRGKDLSKWLDREIGTTKKVVITVILSIYDTILIPCSLLCQKGDIVRLTVFVVIKLGTRKGRTI